ncbi:LysR family transcriptional regulator [Tritonibacter horizontis]|uniref:HTH-type transcriptional activator CmpR n=1 Tax=Tritonibacter horizontis TaxID=1768241 RepID=A0A132BS68_9RHOB|nr:LysR family transcriptional regulator [Tritonibacter horizontis]KUP91238.1 HTH-type transcriptional activator CmpR [Tritonibacter horizontis]
MAMNPGDLLILQAFETQTTYSAAARALAVSHTTVARKIRELEQHYGACLIERIGDRAVLTAEGEAAVRTAQAIRQELRALERRIEGRDQGLFGDITLTTVDVLAWHFMDRLSAFCRRYPEISLTVHAETAVRSLSRREAEVALRLTNAPEPYLYGKCIGRFDFRHYRAARGPAGPGTGQGTEAGAGTDGKAEGKAETGADPGAAAPYWLDYAGQDCAARSAEWFRRCAPGQAARSFLPSPLMMMHAIEAGMGEGLLPDQIAAGRPGLRAVGAEIAYSLDLWLLTPKELRQTARVRALFKALG